VDNIQYFDKVKEQVNFKLKFNWLLNQIITKDSR